MRASAAAKIGQAIGEARRLPKIMLSLGEKVTLSETLADVARAGRSLPSSLGNLRASLVDELERARGGEAVQEREARRAARLERERRRIA
jgi:hypothetical protein